MPCRANRRAPRGVAEQYRRVDACLGTGGVPGAALECRGEQRDVRGVQHGVAAAVYRRDQGTNYNSAFDILIEDFSVGTHRWTGPPARRRRGSDPKIAAGTFTGFSILRSLRPGPAMPGGNQFLCDFLKAAGTPDRYRRRRAQPWRSAGARARALAARYARGLGSTGQRDDFLRTERRSNARQRRLRAVLRRDAGLQHDAPLQQSRHRAACVEL